MKSYNEYTEEELINERASLTQKYNEYIKKGLKLDLSRGKPNSSQLDISKGLLSVDLTGSNSFSDNGLDCRNYGVLDGLPEMKALI